MERPILFNTEMVRAILDGRKTQTRRIIKPQPCPEATRFERFIHTEDCGWEARFSNSTSGAVCDRKLQIDTGDVLWVRETWYKNYSHEYGRYWYRADGEEIDMPTIYGGTVVYGKADGLKWRPSIHMPREACRIKLQVTNVRVERLQDITEEDVAKEGTRDGENYITPKGQDVAPWHIACFEMLWNSTLKEKQTGPLSPYRFCFNLWVWVISF